MTAAEKTPPIHNEHLFTILSGLALIVLAYFLTITFSPKFQQLKKLVIIAISITVSSATISFLSVAITSGLIEKNINLENNIPQRITHCKETNNESKLCWGITTLKKQGIPVEEKNISALDGLNGQYLSLTTLMSSTLIPSSYAIEKKTLPTHLFFMISRAYATSLEFAINADKMDEVYLGYTCEESCDPNENLKWAIKARDNFDSFIADYENAPEGIKKDVILSSLYKLHAGEWTEREEDGVMWYYAGVFTTSTNTQVETNKLSLYDISLLSEIPQAVYPHAMQ
jgi:hypothetical protein